MGVALEWLEKNREGLVAGTLEDDAIFQLLTLDISNDSEIAEKKHTRYDEFAIQLGSEIMKGENGKEVLHNLNKSLLEKVQGTLDEQAGELVAPVEIKNPGSAEEFDLFEDDLEPLLKENQTADEQVKEGFAKRKTLISASIERSLLAYEYTVDEKNALENAKILPKPTPSTSFSTQHTVSPVGPVDRLKTNSTYIEKILEEKYSSPEPTPASTDIKAPYEEALDKLTKTMDRIKPEYANLKNKVQNLINHVKELKTNGESEEDLIKVLEATSTLLEEGKNGVENYKDVANNMRTKSSPGLQLLGGLMIAIGVLIVGLGVGVGLLISATGLGVAISVAGVGIGAAGAATFFKGSSKDTALSKQMHDVKNQTKEDSEADSPPKPEDGPK